MDAEIGQICRPSTDGPTPSSCDVHDRSSAQRSNFVVDDELTIAAPDDQQDVDLVVDVVDELVSALQANDVRVELSPVGQAPDRTIGVALHIGEFAEIRAMDRGVARGRLTIDVEIVDEMRPARRFPAQVAIVLHGPTANNRSPWDASLAAGHTAVGPDGRLAVSAIWGERAEDAEFVALRIRQRDPGGRVVLSDVDLACAARQHPLDLERLVVGTEVDVDTILELLPSRDVQERHIGRYPVLR